MSYSIEKIVHFRCNNCDKWWSVGDAPIEETSGWYCTWCGVFQKPEERIQKNIDGVITDYKSFCDFANKNIFTEELKVVPTHDSDKFFVLCDSFEKIGCKLYMSNYYNHIAIKNCKGIIRDFKFPVEESYVYEFITGESYDS